jgi:hypothetical protein
LAKEKIIYSLAQTKYKGAHGILPAARDLFLTKYGYQQANPL